MTLEVTSKAPGYIDGKLVKYPVIVEAGKTVALVDLPNNRYATTLILVGQAKGGYIKGNGVYPRRDWKVQPGQSSQLGVFTVKGS